MAYSPAAGQEEGEKPHGVLLTIGEQEGHHLYDAQQEPDGDTVTAAKD